MEKCLRIAKELISNQVNDNKIINDSHKVYFWTNENIEGYLDMVDLRGKKRALSVLASGDHVFNLIAKGLREIDAFDINELTEYFALGIKWAMIKKYSNMEFMEVAHKLTNPDIALEEITEIVRELLPYMEEKYQLFWKNVIEYNYLIQKSKGTNLNLFYLLCINIDRNTFYLYDNAYLGDEYNYNIVKSSLDNTIITFKGVNATDLDKYFTDKYDVIILSNILDYFASFWGFSWDYSKLKMYEKKLEQLGAKDAIIFLKYIFNYVSNRHKKKFLVEDSTVSLDNLKDEWVIEVECNHKEDLWDGMILKRVK